MITVFIKSLFLIFALSDQNKLIENENISVEYVFNLVEETKKKNTYNIKFILKNKAQKPLYYVASYVKSETKISTNNLNLVSDKTDEIDDVGSNAPPPLSSSAYVDSGGAAKVDSESSSSVGGKKSSSTSKKDDIKTAQSTFVEYSLNNDLIMLNLEEAKPSKFTIFSSVKQDKIFFFNNREKINIPIAFDNITNQKIEVGLLDYDPVICVIPIEGLEINSTLITNVKKGIDPEDFYLKFSKNIVFTNSIKLELEKSFHLSIESAIEKYKELQSVLKNN
ncbi:MAG: hypothetical protein VXV77_02855 [Bacteroidota bacterium]|jgi:hypothetical protein|nr:hypothetical protein [Bacteroidota bacterium]|tara:strand:- start:3297 stop:4133 length:837 start_codon:yes stop_codon:yes gene_type:complete